jgi:uncharacterized membrane protein (UPF0127 family)
MTRVLGGLWLALWCAIVAAQTGPSWPVLLERADHSNVTLALEVAATPAARQLGLMGRKALAAGQGMLFDSGRDEALVLWMKNTLIPLDMIFISDEGEVTQLVTHTTPLSEALIYAKRQSRYVIEIGAGEAARLRIEPGMRLRLPRGLTAPSL